MKETERLAYVLGLLSGLISHHIQYHPSGVSCSYDVESLRKIVARYSDDLLNEPTQVEPEEWWRGRR